MFGMMVCLGWQFVCGGSVWSGSVGWQCVGWQCVGRIAVCVWGGSVFGMTVCLG